MAIPLMVLYEVSIFVAKFARRKRPAAEATDSPAEETESDHP
jgi:Sec-independent protein secretion pathway component TatC